MGVMHLVIYDLFFRGMSLWLVGLTTLVIVLLAVYLGYRIGMYLRLRNKGGGELFSGSVVTASLGLLAFMLAFTFNIAANRYTERKEILLNEVNAIGTTHLRADFLPNPSRDEIKKLLRNYVDMHAILVERSKWRDSAKLKELINQAEAVQDNLWAQTVPIAKQYPDSEVVGLFITSLNELIDLHTERIVVALQYHIPGAIWGALYLLSILSFGLVGYELGASKTGSVLVSIIMAVTFATVILLITDLDRPNEGYIFVNQQPMIQLQQKLNHEAESY